MMNIASAILGGVVYILLVRLGSDNLYTTPIRNPFFDPKVVRGGGIWLVVP